MDIREYEDEGYLPEAMLNYLVRLGWSHGDKEIFSVGEMTELFDLDDVNQSASSFNPEKLLWINQQHIIAAPADKLGEALKPFLVKEGLDTANGPDPADVAEGFRERAETLARMAASARYCYEDFDSRQTRAADSRRGDGWTGVAADRCHARTRRAGAHGPANAKSGRNNRGEGGSKRLI